jgi:plasmid stability protein
LNQSRHIQAIVPRPLAERLEARAQASERSVSAEIRLILRDTFANEESAGQGALVDYQRGTAREHVHA